MDNDRIKKIVMQLLVETQEDSVGSGRDLFWHPLKGVFSTWIYMLGKSPLASAWLEAADGLWHYCIPRHGETGIIGTQEFRIDAMACVEQYLANDDSLDR